MHQRQKLLEGVKILLSFPSQGHEISRRLVLCGNAIKQDHKLAVTHLLFTYSLRNCGFPSTAYFHGFVLVPKDD